MYKGVRVYPPIARCSRCLEGNEKELSLQLDVHFIRLQKI